MSAKKYLFLKASLYLLLLSLASFASVKLYSYLKPLFVPFDTPFVTSYVANKEAEEKIKSKVNLAPPLNYSSSSEAPGLSTIPRYLVYNSDSQRVYAAKSYQDSFSPASFTKLMTASVALDLLPPDLLLTATRTSIDKEPTILGLKVGEQLPIYDLLRASIATSANDAAATLAENSAGYFGGSLDLFVSLMNNKAKLLNMKDTHFANAEGYDSDNQYITLNDLYKLVWNVQQNYPSIITAGSSDREDIKVTQLHNGYYLSNWNGLLGVYPGVNGLKIAYTEKAGYSTIVTAARKGVNVVAIIGGAKSIPERDLAAASLLDLAFQKEGLRPVRITRKQLQKRYNVWNALIAKLNRE